MLSVIIPTYNEEKYLPRLLSCLKNQTFKDFEVIIADANSKDKTTQIAKDFGAKVVEGGKTSVGRNNGAKASKEQFLVFMDADIQFEKDFLSKSIKNFVKKSFDVANPYYEYSSKNKKLATVSSAVFDVNRKMRQRTFAPLGTGECLFITKEAFDDIGGFSETLTFGEDNDLIRKAKKKKYKFGILKSRFTPSFRRLEKNNMVKVMAVIWVFTVFELIRVSKKKKIQKFVTEKYGGWGHE